MIHQEVIYSRLADFRPLALDLHVPADVRSAPVVVWIHGGGFRAGDRRSLPHTVRPNAVFDALTTAGLACATIDYRLAGEAIWPAQRDDVNAAIDSIAAHADQYGIDADRVGIWGESAGAHLALMAAMTNPHVKLPSRGIH